MSEFFFWFSVVPLVLFLFLYGFFSAWHTNDVGRVEMALSFALLLIAFPGIVRRITDQSPEWLQIFSTIALVITGVILWWRVVVWFRVQLRRKHDHERNRT